MSLLKIAATLLDSTSSAAVSASALSLCRISRYGSSILPRFYFASWALVRGASRASANIALSRHVASSCGSRWIGTKRSCWPHPSPLWLARHRNTPPGPHAFPARLRQRFTTPALQRR